MENTLFLDVAAGLHAAWAFCEQHPLLISLFPEQQTLSFACCLSFFNRPPATSCSDVMRDGVVEFTLRVHVINAGDAPQALCEMATPVGSTSSLCVVAIGLARKRRWSSAMCACECVCKPGLAHVRLAAAYPVGSRCVGAPG